MCDFIEKGSYKIPRSGNQTITKARGIVDNYHKVLYCQNAKVASTSWVEMFTIMIREERLNRRKWFAKHPHPWYDNFPRGFERFK